MSRIATDWAWNCKAPSSSAKLVLLAFADRADEHHQCYPSIERIVSDTGLNRKTIIKVIQTLETEGFISDTGERKGATQQVKVYRLNIAENSTKTGTVPKLEQFQKRNSTNITSKESQFYPSNSPKIGTQNQSIEPVIETVKENKQKKTPLLQKLIDGYPHISPDSIRAIHKHRKEKRAAMTDYGFKLFFDELARCANTTGLSQEQIIDIVIKRDWKGLETDWVINHLKGTGQNSVNDALTNIYDTTWQ